MFLFQIAFLKRYREFRNLTPLPLPTNAEKNEPLVLSGRTRKGLATRQIRNILSEAFEEACSTMIKEGFVHDANELKAATSHWLRHTGASMEVTANRPLRHIQSDLGHGSIKTTDELYIDSDNKEIAASAKNIPI